MNARFAVLVLCLLICAGARAAAPDNNTTNIDPSLYTKHKPSRDGRPLAAHCRNVVSHVNGHERTRRVCVTPAQ